MTTFTVTAQRGTRRWVLQCVEHPGALSEVARLSEADGAIREAIAYVAGLPEDSFTISVIPSIDPRVTEHLEAAAALRDIGTIMGLSHQRVDQLLSDSGHLRRAR